MNQFTLFENTDKDTRKAYPYFLNVQSDLVSVLNSRMVIPVVLASQLEKSAPERLCPAFQLGGTEYALLTYQMASAPISMLKKPVVSLDFFRDEIINAIDLLITGI
ncbi:CcdB family protein [Microbulbifer rhizosphaerae]|uniref:Toxin CcdB n=1 Tax=Microbulbifer rhizosphaerae TaxID=1562603 RepID=A0A7W4Z7W6_9GAMM|nr:CcdB family protein [Microbulbifer rhizosphaerae]MBB3059952.1 toxin CcdB [Microbulbifer rhizosphaerae]